VGLALALLVCPPGEGGQAPNAGPSALDERLIAAAIAGDVATMHRLLSRGAHVEARTERGDTVLRLAYEYGRAASVKFLLDHGADPSTAGLDRADALVWAAQAGNVGMVRFLLQSNPSRATKDRALIAVSSFAVAQLDDAAEPGRSTAVVKSVDPRPTLDAVGTVRLLLSNGANIEARQDDSGRTPLILAAGFALTDVARALIERGAKLEARDEEGGTALAVAACSCAQASMNDTRPAIRLLLAHGARIDTRDAAGRTPLMTAVAWGRAHTAALLLERGAGVDVRDDDGQTALMVISDARDEDVKLTALLLKYGADPRAKDRRGMTAVDRAAGHGYAAALKLLTRPRNRPRR
jgi:ankyrin repeat protein